MPRGLAQPAPGAVRNCCGRWRRQALSTGPGEGRDCGPHKALGAEGVRSPARDRSVHAKAHRLGCQLRPHPRSSGPDRRSRTVPAPSRWTVRGCGAASVSPPSTRRARSDPGGCYRAWVPVNWLGSDGEVTAPTCAGDRSAVDRAARWSTSCGCCMGEIPVDDEHLEHERAWVAAHRHPGAGEQRPSCGARTERLPGPAGARLSRASSAPTRLTRERDATHVRRAGRRPDRGRVPIEPSRPRRPASAWRRYLREVALSTLDERGLSPDAA